MQHTSLGAWRAARAGVILAMVLVIAVAVPRAPVGAQEPEAKPSTVVSLGDSFISGEGGRWKGNSNMGGSATGTDRAYRSYWIFSWYDPAAIYGPSYANGCHRSDVTPVTWIDDLGYDAQVNLACSGAASANIVDTPMKYEQPQAAQLAALAETHDVDAVVLSIGGNDLADGGFAELVTQCVVSYLFNLPECRSSSPLAPGIEDVVAANIDRATAGIEASIAAIRTALASDTDGYRMVLMTPPSPVPAEVAPNFADKWFRTDAGHCPFYDGDLAYVRNTLVPATIAGAWSTVADTAGVELLDLSDALAGREMCAPGAELGSNPATAQWFRYISINPFFGMVQESAHPNAYGQEAIGTCLALQLSSAGADSTCHRASDNSLPGDMVLVPRQ